MTSTLDRGRLAAPPAPGTGYRPDIEGLRAVAVLLVVLYHCAVPFLPGGYVGVDVFFVISGYLITGLLLREQRLTGRISVVGFYARRALRLLPAAAIVVAATVVAAYRWMPALRGPEVARDAFFTMLYGVNYHLAAAGADYLNADADPSPLQHFWSLAVEEQFYLIWPLLLILAGRFRRAALVGLVAGSLAVSVSQTAANPTWAYFGLHTRAWELGAGALIAVSGGRLPRICAPLGLVAVLTSAVVFTDRTAFPGYAALLPVVGAAAVLLGGATAPSRWLTPGPLQRLGRVSYSWYLWHWPVLIIGPVALGRPVGWKLALALAGGALAAAVVTFVVVETPARRIPAMRARPGRTVLAALLVTLLTAGGYGWSSRESPVPAGAAPAAPVLSPANLRQLLSTPVTAVPRNLTPTLRDAYRSQARIYRDGCADDTTDDSIHSSCVYGDPASATTVVLFGDSHAGSWFPAMNQIATERGWKLVVINKNACTAASVPFFNETLRRRFDECDRFRESAFRHIAALHPAMIVVASAAAVADPIARTGDLDTLWVNGWATSAARLTAGGGKLYLIEDTPYQPQRVPFCLADHGDDPAACTNPPSRALLFPARRARIRQVFRQHGATVIDPTPWFCTATACPVIVGNVLVYRDASHITETYARMLAPILGPHLNP